MPIGIGAILVPPGVEAASDLVLHGRVGRDDDLGDVAGPHAAEQPVRHADMRGTRGNETADLGEDRDGAAGG